jgi:hypothetical protein
MLKWLIRRRLDAFERNFDYDASYAREILEVDARAFFAFARASSLNYRRDVALDVLYAVKLVGTMAEDCGPCTQLIVTMGLRDRVDPRTLSAVVRGLHTELSDDVRLGVQFADAVLRHDPEANPLREEVLRRWGPRALVSMAFALTASRLFPTLKYALGHGQACQRVVVGGEPVPVLRGAA